MKNTIALLEERKIAFKEKYADAKIRNFTWLVERELDSWEQDIFPVYSMLSMPKYQTLIEEHLMGVVDGEISVVKLTETINRVRQKRAKKALKGGVSLHPVSTAVPSAVAPHPVYGGSVVGVSPAVVSMPMAQVEPLVEAPMVSHATGEYGFNIPDYVSRMESVIEPVGFTHFPDEIKRIVKEKEDGFPVSWSNVDEFIFKQFQEKLFNHSKIQLLDNDKYDFLKPQTRYIEKALRVNEEKAQVYAYLMLKLRVHKR